MPPPSSTRSSKPVSPSLASDARRAEADAERAGLCATCVHCRVVKTARSQFFLCERSFADPNYAKYPPIPVRSCPGYEAVAREP